MEEFHIIIEMLFIGIFNTFNEMKNIEFLGTNLLQLTIGFIIANALVNLMIVVNKSRNKTGDKKK